MFPPMLLSSRKSFLPLPRSFFVALLLLGLLCTLAPDSALAQTVPATNPDLTPFCGLKVILALDESGSLQGFEPTVRNSVRALLEGLADTGSQVALVEFNLDARTPLGPVYHEVTTGTNGTISQGGVFDLYLDNNYQPNGYTNWDAAFVQIEALNRTQGMASLVIFFTDSGPNVYINPFGTTVGGNDTVALTEAVQSANLVKAQGSHIFVVGVGNINDEAKVIDVSGPDKYPQANLPFGQADYTVTAFDQLEATLREIVFNLCAPSFVVTKRLNTGSGLGYELRPDQPFTGTVHIIEPGQDPAAFEWALPVAGPATQLGQAQPLVTNHNGLARWQWEPGTRANSQPWSSQFNLAETLQPGDSFVEALCTRRTLGANGAYTASNFTVTALPTTVAMAADDIVLCEVRNSHVDIAVKKSANPTTVPESGADVTFTFDVFNGGGTTVALTGLVDTVFGNLHGQGTCIANGLIVISANSTYRCTVTQKIAGNVGTPHVNTVTATVRDAQGVTVSRSATAAVNFSDAAPLVLLTRSAVPDTRPEPGGAVVYMVQVSNQNGGEPLTLSSFTDTRYGDITSVGGAISATTCAAPQTIARAGLPGATYSCQFTVQLNGPPGAVVDTLQATVTDDDGNTQPVSKEQLVMISNVPPTANVTITPVPASLAEPGGMVTMMVAVANTSAAEALTLTSLTDSRYGVLTTVGGAVATTTCTLPQTLAPVGQPNATYQCTFTSLVTGAPGFYPNTLQATVNDDEGGSLQVEQASAVEITDLPASLLVTKRAAQTSLPEPGGPMTFSVTIVNTSAIDHVRVDRVVDDHFGDVSATCTPALPVDRAPQQQVQCVFVGQITGAVGTRHINEVTATGTDDDGKIVTDRDQEVIEITDLPARLDILQVAEPSNLAEPGGTVAFTTFIKNISRVDTIRLDQIVTNAINETVATLTLNASCSAPLPTSLLPGEQLRCQFTKVFTGPVGARHLSLVTITGVDDDLVPVQQTGYEAVEIVDVPATLHVTAFASPVSVPEAGGTVNFTVEILNSSAVDTITLQTLENSLYGSLQSTCAAPFPLVLHPGDKVRCAFSRLVTGDNGALLNLRTSASGTDDEGKPVSDDALVTIGISDTPSSIKVVQTATPTSIREPGGEVRFTVDVENTSPVDTVTIQTVSDSRFGLLNSMCTPALPAALAPRTKLSCSFTQSLFGDVGTHFASTISATGVDDDGQTVTDFDLGNLDVVDVTPQLLIDVTAAPNRVLATGEMVNFTVRLVNHGPEAITVEKLVDTQAHSAALQQGQADCTFPQTLVANGGSYTCVIRKMVAGSSAATYEALLTATATDNDGNQVQMTDEADVFLLAVSPDLVLTKRDSLVIDNFTSEQDRGLPSPGDTLGYEIVVRNRGNGAATDVLLTDLPDANTRLVAGSVQTSQGTIAQGNAAGNEFVIVTVGDLEPGGQVTIRFQVIIVEGAGATLLRNQATISQGITGATVAGSDDPDTPFVGDPTDTVVTLPPTGLPPEEEPIGNLSPGRIFLPLITQR